MTDLTAMIEQATAKSQQALEDKYNEQAARRKATDAENEARDTWNVLYKALLELWKKRHDYPGLDDSNFGLLFRSVQLDLNDRPRPIKGHPQSRLNGATEAEIES